MSKSMQIIGITGLPSSGKGEFSKIAKQFGFREIIMGDVIRREIKDRNLELTRENSNKVMLELREEKGKDIVAELTLEQIEEALDEGSDKILIDGIRSLHEVRLFRTHYPKLKIIAIHADPDTRFERSKNRKRKDDAYTRESFDKRDQVELKVGIGNVIALADIMIISPDTLEEAGKIYSNVIKHILNINSTPLVY